MTRQVFRTGLCFLALAFTFALCPSAAGWSGNTHRRMVAEALQRMPSRFLVRFAPFKDELMRGSTYPDVKLRDFQHHVFHPHERRDQPAEAFCRDTFRELTEMLRGKAPDHELAFRLGIFAHYLGDWNQPLHTAGRATDPGESEYHPLFERDVEILLGTLSVGKIVPARVVDPVARLREMALSAFSDYATIGRAYRKGSGIAGLRPCVHRQYRASVQAIVDFWSTLLLEAGQLSLSDDLSSASRASPPHGFRPSFPLSRSTVDLNTAGFDDLLKLPGVGPAKARAIIAARPFRSPFDLGRVRGFGRRSAERLLERITISPNRSR